MRSASYRRPGWEYWSISTTPGLRRITVRLVGEGRAVLRPLTAVELVGRFTRYPTAAALDSEG